MGRGGRSWKEGTRSRSTLAPAVFKSCEHFCIHIAYNSGNNTPPAPGSGLKDPIFHELNECKEKVKPIARNLSWSREVIRKSESPNTLVLTAASLAGHLSPNRDSRGSVRSPALRKYLRCAGWPAALARQEKGAG